MRLIDAEAMDDKLETLMIRCRALVNKRLEKDYKFVRTVLGEAPTVDAVPVVRCKDCKKISPSVTPVKNTVWCREFRAYMPCDGFCSYGEREVTDG